MSTTNFAWQGSPVVPATVTLTVVRLDTNQTILSNFAMTPQGGGLYTVNYTDPAAFLLYQVTIAWIYADTTSGSTSYQLRGGGGAIGHYAQQSDLEKRFGVNNIKVWSHLDGESGDANQARIAMELAYADEEIYANFRGTMFDPPSVNPITTRWAVQIAGSSLYNNRGQRTEGDENNQYNSQLKKYYDEMKPYICGIRRFAESPIHSTVPELLC